MRPTSSGRRRALAPSIRVMVIEKTPYRKTSGPSRPYGMNGNKDTFARLMPPAFMFIVLGRQEAQVANTPAAVDRARRLKQTGAMFLLAAINEIVRPDIIVHPPRILKIITIAGITQQECNNWTRMTKDELLVVYERLQFPHGEINVVGRSFHLKFDSQWLFLVVLFRLCHGTDFEGMISTFGKESTQLCRAFNWGIDWLYRAWAFHKLHDNVGEISERIPSYCERIETKVIALAGEINVAAQQLVDEGEDVAQWTLQEVNMGEAPNVFGLVDGTQREVRRPKAGPVHAGPRAPRHPHAGNVQHAFYSGKQGYCSEKFITFNGPDGHIIFCSEPYSGRNHDADVVRRIKLHDKLVAAQALLPPPLRCIYGDSAFARQVCIQKRFAFPPTNNQKMLNVCFNKVRTSVEHIYGIVLSSFKLNMVWWKKSVSNRIHQMIWPVSCFFSNILNCLHHNQISTYFALPPMSIEAYLYSDGAEV